MAGSGEELIIKNVSIVEKRDGLFWHQQRMKPIRSYSLYFDTDYGGVKLAVGVTNGNPWIKLYSWREEYGALFDVE